MVTNYLRHRNGGVLFVARNSPGRIPKVFLKAQEKWSWLGVYEKGYIDYKELLIRQKLFFMV